MSIGTNSELGYRSIIATEPEIVYGVAQTTTSATNYTEVTSFSPSMKIEELKSPELNSTRDYTRRFQMNKTVDGSVEKHLHPIDGIDLLRHALGGTLSTTALSTGVYQHDITPDDTQFAIATATETSLTIDARKGPNRTYRYTGLRVNNMTITGEIGSPVTVAYELLGKDAASLTAGSSLTDTAVSYSCERPFLFQDISMQYADTVASLTTTSQFSLVGCEIGVANNLNGDTRSLGTDTVSDLPPGRRDVTAKLTMRADTSTVYEWFRDGTAKAVRFIIEGSSITAGDNFSLAFTMPEVYFNNADPEIGDEGVIMIEPELTVVRACPIGTTTSYAVKCELVNNVTSY